MESLNAFEQAVLDRLLAGDHPVLVALRTQAGRAQVTRREHTERGFSCEFETPADLPPAETRSDFRIGDVNASLDGLEHGAGFLLFIRNGRLAMLEGYTYEEPWPQEVRNLKLSYQREPRELPFL
jgi:hypothetical protein